MNKTEPQSAGSAQTPRLLLADDDAISLKVTGLLLRAHGYEVDAVNSGHGALAALEHGEYAAALIDIEMPGMDGFTVAAQIRARQANETIPLIAITGHATNEDRRRILAAGFNDYLAKPVDLEALGTAVRRNLPDFLPPIPARVQLG